MVARIAAVVAEIPTRNAYFFPDRAAHVAAQLGGDARLEERFVKKACALGRAPVDSPITTRCIGPSGGLRRGGPMVVATVAHPTHDGRFAQLAAQDIVLDHAVLAARARRCRA